ncbi:hypothetical protein OG930_40080 [Streptomyces sp. NBC_01799]|nr:hypothetical protein [Streptomyces sp. NBC_01800]WSA72705.1 hypothetical protein OIE65_40675 [Streptomyces sp. NBC_01800]WSA81232.1 hypothetical protein OG930_40080 [Streptomyces sp. NBC_01799]
MPTTWQEPTANAATHSCIRVSLPKEAARGIDPIAAAQARLVVIIRGRLRTRSHQALAGRENSRGGVFCTAARMAACHVVAFRLTTATRGMATELSEEPSTSLAWPVQ